MTRAELKQAAKARLKGKWGWAVGFHFVAVFFANVVGWLTFGIIALMVTAGIAFTFLKFMDDREQDRNIYSNIFSAFTSGQPIAVFLNTMLSVIFISLWSLLLVVPGIIKALAYSQTNYILKDMQAAGIKITPTGAIAASRQLMVGHKGEYFLLQLSFIGWALVATLTFGIGFLWLAPYIQATNAAYYRNLAGDQFTQPAL